MKSFASLSVQNVVVRAEVIGTIALALLGPLVIGLTGNSLVVGAGYFMTMLILPLLNVFNRSAWQTAVPLVYQGRVFSIKRMISGSLAPLGLPWIRELDESHSESETQQTG